MLPGKSVTGSVACAMAGLLALGIVIWTPPAVSFGFSVATAVAWSAWLDRGR